MNDLISRQAAIDAILHCENHVMEHDYEFNEGLIAAINAVEELPTAEPSATLMKVEVGVDKESLRKAMEEAELTLVAEPRKGKWIEDGYSHYKAVCDQCGEPCATYVLGKPRDKYCKYCGAKMEE